MRTKKDVDQLLDEYNISNDHAKEWYTYAYEFVQRDLLDMNINIDDLDKGPRWNSD